MRAFLASAVLIAFILSVVSTRTVVAQSMRTEHVYQLDDDDDRPMASIDDLAWLAGQWVGEGLGGHVEETWNDPSAGTMLGSFKLVHGDDVSLYELELLTEVEGSLAWLVKHFGPEFDAWEEKEEYVSFPLVKIEERAAYFDGLTVELQSDETLVVYLVMRSQGEVREEKLTYRRVR